MAKTNGTWILILAAIAIIYLDLMLMPFNLALVTTNTSVSNTTGRETTSEGCAEGWGYYVDDVTPICEPLDAIGKGPPVLPPLVDQLEVVVLQKEDILAACRPDPVCVDFDVAVLAHNLAWDVYA